MERRLHGGGGAGSYSSETLTNFQPEKNFPRHEESRRGGGLSLFKEFSFQNRRLFGDLVNGGVGMEAFKFCRKCVFRFPGK